LCFERNDLFDFLQFSSVLLIVFGSSDGFVHRFFIGLGILAYGLDYFIVHDIIIHQRFKFPKTKTIFSYVRPWNFIHKHLGKKMGDGWDVILVLRSNILKFNMSLLPVFK
jgi:beta-carotene 3-hydroxylase